MAFHTGYYCCPGQTTIWVIISYPPLLLLYFPSDVIFFISCPKLLCASKIAISFLQRADWFSAVVRTPCRCKKEINRTSGEKNSVQAVFSLHIHCNAWSSRINPRPFQLFSTQCPEMQNHSGPFLLGTMWICSDSPSWEEFAAWMPKTVQIKHKPRKSWEAWPRSPTSLWQPGDLVCCSGSWYKVSLQPLFCLLSFLVSLYLSKLIWVLIFGDF